LSNILTPDAEGHHVWEQPSGTARWLVERGVLFWWVERFATRVTDQIAARFKPHFHPVTKHSSPRSETCPRTTPDNAAGRARNRRVAPLPNVRLRGSVAA
jgi:hypothetical protein